METQTLKTLAASRLVVVATPSVAGQDVASAVESALRGGADVVQFRDKHSSALDILEAAKQLNKICRDYNALFIVNDRVDIALASGADGVHLGQDDLPLEDARKIAALCGRADSFLIGRSTHS